MASSRKFEGKSSRRGHEIQLPNYTREPRHFARMQKAIQARGEPNEDWINKKINELQQRPSYVSDAASQLFTGHQAAQKVEFPRAPRLELDQKHGFAGDIEGRSVRNQQKRGIAKPVTPVQGPFSDCQSDNEEGNPAWQSRS